MRHSLSLLIAPLVLLSAMPAEAARMRLQCQHNVEDGRTLVANANVLPEGAAVKIISYRPMSRDGMWTYGPCIANVTREPID